MPSLRLSLLVPVLLLALAACTNRSYTSGKEEIPKGAKWLYPVYSHLFALATFEGDTFLLLKDPADTARELGTWCWGNGNKTYNKIQRIAHRNKIVVTTAVFVGMLENLHQEWRICGIDNGDYVTSRRTSEMIKEGKVASVAKTGDLSREAVARLKPDLLIGYYIEPKGKENLLQAARSGCSVMFFQNFLETHPLGRAEWIKIFGFLTGKAKEAMAQFAEIEEHYISTAARAEEAKHLPTVLINAPFAGIWHIPAGQSYMAQLVYDAGGDYIWQKQPGPGRVPMDIEKVYAAAANADVWLNPGSCRDYICLQTIDSRLMKFSAFQQKRVYNCTRLLNEKGANPYWEYGVVRPDLVLLDVFTILHPELEAEHQLVFFEKLK